MQRLRGKVDESTVLYLLALKCEIDNEVWNVLFKLAVVSKPILHELLKSRLVNIMDTDKSFILKIGTSSWSEFS